MSFTFANLPGVQVATVDGGLAAVNTPTTKSILVLGTSAIGPANSPFQVVSLAAAAKAFGLAGTLVRGMSESATYSDNVALFRVGTGQASILVGNTGSSSLGTNNVVFSATAVGGQITYSLGPSAIPSADLNVGDPLTITGFTNTEFNSPANPGTNTYTVAGFGAHSIIVDAPYGTVADATEGIYSDNYAVTSGATMQATSTTALTVDYTGATPANFPAGIKDGDSVTLAGLIGPSASFNRTYLVASHTGTTVLHLTTLVATLVVSGPTAATAGTLASHRNAPAALFIPAQDGFLVKFGQVDASYLTRYKIFYDGLGSLTIWLDNSVVFSNDPSLNVNTGDSEVTGSSSAGTAVNGGTNVLALANAITVGTAITNVVVISETGVVDGIGLTSRDLYVAQQNAMTLLAGFPVDIVVVPGALADQANVATKDSTVSRETLDYLWTGIDNNGDPIYQYASDNFFISSDNRHLSGSVTLQGGVVAVATVTTFSSETDRLSKGVGVAHTVQPSGFHEVNFAYQLARFCAAQSEAPQADNGGCLGFIGTKGPVNLSDFSLSAVRNWIGHLPVFDPITGLATSSGTGLLGIPFLVGAASGDIDSKASNRSPARIPGLFSTASGEYDGGAEIDANGSKIDIGAYVQVQGDYALQSNGFGTYVGNIAGVIAGLTSSLDAKRAITNKQVAGVSQLYRASLQQLDNLTFADVDVLRFKGTGQLPVALHDKTSATVASDYTLALRQRIKFLVIQTLLRQAQNFIGNGTNDGLSLTALKTALDADLLTLQKRGYLSKYTFTITSTKAQQKVGQASIQISFVPANELVQLNATVGINLAA